MPYHQPLWGTLPFPLLFVRLYIKWTFLWLDTNGVLLLVRLVQPLDSFIFTATFTPFPHFFLDIVKTGYDMLLLVLLLSLLLALILFSKNHNDIDTIHKADPITVRLCLPNERRTIGLLPVTATSSQCYAFTKTTKFFNTVYLVEYKNPVAAAMRRRGKHLKSKSF